MKFLLVIAELNLEYFGMSIIFGVEANARMLCFCFVLLVFDVTTCFEMCCCVCMMSSEWKHTSVVQFLFCCSVPCFVFCARFVELTCHTGCPKTPYGPEGWSFDVVSKRSFMHNDWLCMSVIQYV